MKSFKRSRTINFNNDESEEKKIKSKNQHLDEIIQKIVNYIKKEQNSFLPVLKVKQDITLFFKKSKSKNMLEIKKKINDLEMIKYILTKSKKSENDILIIKLYLSTMSFLLSSEFTFIRSIELRIPAFTASVQTDRQRSGYQSV